jgi:hypothetical protein
MTRDGPAFEVEFTGRDGAPTAPSELDSSASRAFAVALCTSTSGMNTQIEDFFK